MGEFCVPANSLPVRLFAGVRAQVTGEVGGARESLAAVPARVPVRVPVNLSHRSTARSAVRCRPQTTCGGWNVVAVSIYVDRAAGVDGRFE